MTESITDVELCKSLFNRAGFDDDNLDIQPIIHAPSIIQNTPFIEELDSDDGDSDDSDGSVHQQENIGNVFSGDQEDEDSESSETASLLHQAMDNLKDSASVHNEVRAQTPSTPLHTSDDIPPSNHQPFTESLNAKNYNQADFADVDVDTENKHPPTRREKQEILFQLLKEYPCESQGQWSLKMPLFELKYELSRRQKLQEETDQLCLMKQGLKMILMAIEAANSKFGPFLELKGWANSVTSDMSKYDRCLKAIYRRYFRRKTTHPVYELAWLIVGSAIMWHIQHKIVGKPSGYHPDFGHMHDIKPPPGVKVPFEQPGKAKSSSSGLNIASILKLFL